MADASYVVGLGYAGRLRGCVYAPRMGRVRGVLVAEESLRHLVRPYVCHVEVQTHVWRWWYMRRVGAEVKGENRLLACDVSLKNQLL